MYHTETVEITDTVAIGLQFRACPNAVLCNTLVNEDPLISTTAGHFH